MNRTDWESQVYDSNMNDTAVAVALAIGWHGHWTQEKPVEPGESTIAKMSRKDRKTVGKYVEAMVSQGWLKPLGTGRYNTTIYEMCEVKEPVTGILAHKKKNMSERQLRNLSTTTKRLRMV